MKIAVVDGPEARRFPSTVRLYEVLVPRYEKDVVDLVASPPNRLTPHFILNHPKWPRKYRGPRLNRR